MKLHVRFRNLEASPELQRQVVRRIHFALARLAHAVQRVTVTLGDVNGPRGGIDKACQVRVEGPRLGVIVIQAAAADPVAALDEAVGRAARTTARTLHRRRLREHVSSGPTSTAANTDPF
ncbi:MAG: HPF/RaiA family ribosome-associated protein [Kofleriaceae bacterium]|nr:MAG: HPF/RaiA family ribosome-associated protein [Kofleriaceae bacterium]